MKRTTRYSFYLEPDSKRKIRVGEEDGRDEVRL